MHFKIEASFIDIKKFFILLFSRIFTMTISIAWKKNHEYSYAHGKHCKTRGLQSFPFKKSVFRQVECVGKYDNLQLATKNSNCIYRSDCFIYDDILCYQKWPSDTISIKVTKNLCYSLKPFYVMIGILSKYVNITITFGIWIVYHFYKTRWIVLSFN